VTTTFDSVNDENLQSKIKATIALFTTLYKVVLSFGPVDRVLKCADSNESY